MIKSQTINNRKGPAEHSDDQVLWEASCKSSSFVHRLAGNTLGNDIMEEAAVKVSRKQECAEDTEELPCPQGGQSWDGPSEWSHHGQAHLLPSPQPHRSGIGSRLSLERGVT